MAHIFYIAAGAGYDHFRFVTENNIQCHFGYAKYGVPVGGNADMGQILVATKLTIEDEKQAAMVKLAYNEFLLDPKSCKDLPTSFDMTKTR